MKDIKVYHDRAEAYRTAYVANLRLIDDGHPIRARVATEADGWVIEYRDDMDHLRGTLRDDGVVR